MRLSATHSTRILFVLVLGLLLAPTATHAQKPPPPRPGDGRPPPPRGGGGPDIHKSILKTTGAVPVTGEVWVDNWFRLSINGKPLLEDSVPITTERSFNAERFEFRADLPMTIAIELRDFMENQTGLEYIGSGRQQMGDGGAIAQFSETSSGKLLAATDGDWRCLVVQSAPADASCAREKHPDISKPDCAQTSADVPDNWTSPDFDDSSWPKATVHSARDVGPKDGYDRIKWDRSAKLIWGPDLKKNNILYCRTAVGR